MEVYLWKKCFLCHS